MRKGRVAVAVIVVENHITVSINSASSADFSMELFSRKAVKSSLVAPSSITKDSRSSVRRLFSSFAFRHASFVAARACRTESSSDSAFSRPPFDVARAHWTRTAPTPLAPGHCPLSQSLTAPSSFLVGRIPLHLRPSRLIRGLFSF